ncbi:hypothetical protein KCU89_g158, partial [Aureobasidium melanogenum]
MAFARSSSILFLSSWIFVLSSCSFSSILMRCLMMSLMVGVSCTLSALPVLGAGLLRDEDSWMGSTSWAPTFSAHLVTLLVAVGDDFFLGVASADAESESMVIRLSRLGGLPSAPPCLPSLFLFSACSLFPINWSSPSFPSALPCDTSSCLPSLAIPPPLAPPRPLGAGISTPHGGASLEIRENH